MSDLMRECSTAVVPQNTPLRNAAEILITQSFPILVAHDECGQLTGIVAESAVIRELMSASSRGTSIASIQSRHVETVRADTDLKNILHLFRSACHSAIPVVDDSKRPIGLLHRTDIVRMLLSDNQISDAPSAPDGSLKHRPGSELGQKPHFMDERRKRRAAGEDDSSDHERAR